MCIHINTERKRVYEYTQKQMYEQTDGQNDRQTEMAMFGKRASRGGGADRGGAHRGGPRARGKEVGGRTEKGA